MRSGAGASWALAGLALLLAAVAYRGLLTLQPDRRPDSVVADWFFEPSNTSPLVVLALAVWLLFRRWGRLRELETRPGRPAVSALLLGAGLAVLAWAIRSEAPDLQALSLLLVALGVAHLMAGASALRVALLPAIFLFFSIPMPAPLLNQLVWTLQIWTAEYTGALLQLIGIPALVSGDQIVLANSAFGVIETCSGLRSIETLAMLALLMADLFRRRGVHAVLLVAAALPTAFGINGFRAAALVVNPHSDITTVHDLQGVAMLLAGVLLLYLFDGVLARLPGVREDARERSAAPAAGGRGDGAATRPVRRLAGVALLMAVAAALSLWLPPWSLERVERRLPTDAIAVELDDWRSLEHIVTDWMFLGNTAFGATLHRRYGRGSERVEVFVGTWNHGRRFQSAFSPKTAFPGSGWLVEASGTLRLGERLADSRVLRKGTRRMLAAHWYEASAGLGGEALRALLALDSSPLRRPYTPVVVRIATPFSGSPRERSAAEARVAGFAQALDAGVKKIVAPRGLKM